MIRSVNSDTEYRLMIKVNLTGYFLLEADCNNRVIQMGVAQ